MERYTLEDHEVYRKEQDKKAAREAEERREKTEKESVRRAWLADGGSESPEGVMLYERLVLLALAENALARQQAGATKSMKAS